MGNKDRKDRISENEKQMSLIEASLNKNRVTLFLIITMAITLACSYIYDGTESVVPRQYETTASFRYEGRDVYQEGLFKLTHGIHESRGKLPEPGCVAFYD